MVGDHLGSGTGNVDSAGSVTMQRYTPYGAIRSAASNQLESDFTYTGQTDDPGTGLIDYNARHYDPALGRFVMADPVLDGTNRYMYVSGRPTGFVDPSGNESCRVDQNNNPTNDCWSEVENLPSSREPFRRDQTGLLHADHVGLPGATPVNDRRGPLPAGSEFDQVANAMDFSFGGDLLEA